MAELKVTFSNAPGVKSRSDAMAIGGALEGADSFDRETALWNPSFRTPDQIINTVKDTADARSRDSARNDGYISGGASVWKDSIVGSQFRLNANPNFTLLSTYAKGFDEVWADEFQQVVEARFSLLADSNDCWLDASRTNTLTGMVRLAVGVFLMTGEIISTAEWIREVARPYNTCLQFVRSDRLCNPNGQSDQIDLRRGVQKDSNGKAVGFYFRKGDRFNSYPGSPSYVWDYVNARKPWGRKMVLHIIEQQDYDQSRGVSQMVAVLKNIRMTKKFREITLQSAVINATYAAAIESELPQDVMQAVIGSTTSSSPIAGMASVYGGYLGALSSYLSDANNIRVDGATIPHLFPGTKMKLQNAGTPGGVGTSFEESLLRHTAAALDVSYESLSRDFSKTNYSSGRMAMAVQGQAMASKKKHVADRYASDIYALQLEEMIAAGDVPLPRGVKRDAFYLPLAKDAMCRCNWIGSGAGQIDELKETQAATMRINAGISTHEIENGRLGLDWREVAQQRARERKLFESLGLPTFLDITKPAPLTGGDNTNPQGSN